MARCEGVGFELIRFTSASSDRNSVEPNAGDGPGRSWLPEVRIQVFQVPASGSSGGAAPGAWNQRPGPVGIARVHRMPAPSSAARVSALSHRLTEGEARYHVAAIVEARPQPGLTRLLRHGGQRGG